MLHINDSRKLELWVRFKVDPRYSISNYGRVRGTFGQILGLRTNNCGYVQVFIKLNRKTKGFLVHRLVAEAFLNLDLSNLNVQVNHIDKDKSNNHVNNLELCSASQNRSHAFDHTYYLDSSTHKRCRGCEEVKLHIFFTVNRATRDGLSIYCKSCVRKRIKNVSENH